MAITFVGTIFLYTLVGQLRSARPPQPPQTPTAPAAPLPHEAVPAPVAAPAPAEEQVSNAPAEAGRAGAKHEEPQANTLPGPEPLSLQLADGLYRHRDFEHAAVLYEKLARRLPAREENQSLQDLLLLRMALCHRNNGNTTQADTMFRTVSLSRLPVLRALARYHQSLTLVERKRYLEAMTQAYQTIALIEVIDYDRKWTAAVQQQCGLLVAEAMTHHLLALCDADSGAPAGLWSQHPDVDPFVEVEEPQLRVLLASGIQKLEEASLRPQIRPVPAPGALSRWSVICNGAPLEELLARFATQAKLDVRWMDAGPSEAGAARPSAASEDNLRRRPVYLYLTSASAPEVVATAAGSVGLLARMEDKGTVRVLDPAAYASLADHTRLLAEESASLWRHVLLAGESNQHAANGHFALALLHTVREQFDEALAEYKLVANQFPKHSLAPYGLLQSGKLKVRLRDYAGAHEDLKQLVELYPETPLADQACLYLADATMKAGLYEEATGLYHKGYNLGLSLESQTTAALGAGRCFYETGNYEEAANWLNRYVTLARDQDRPEFSTACLLLGKAHLALHKPQQAHAALNLALQGELSRPQHVETIGALAQAYMEQGHFLDALQVLEGAAGWQLSQQESVELLLLRVQVLRSIGLTDRAITLLAEKGPYLPDPELKSRVSIELARCYREAGNLELARKTLAEAFTAAQAGPLAQQVGRELAGTCLRVGQPAQAVSLCTQLAEHAGPADKEMVLDLLADAYRQQQQYDRAVAALLDRHAAILDPNQTPARNDARGTP